MNPRPDAVQDAMQVCWNGHVITDLLRTNPEQRLTHCNRCGAATLERCLTCGRELPGAIAVPGLQPVGSRRAPEHCLTCGSAFPWAQKPPLPAADPLSRLETLLRRLPRVIRELRSRQGDAPPFRVVEERDLEDLLRAVLPLQFDDVRPERRSPRSAARPRTDFLLPAEGLALTARIARRDSLGNGVAPTWFTLIAEQLQEDSIWYRQQTGYRTLVGFIYDPEGLLPNRTELETACSRREDDREIRCVVALP